MRLYTVGHSVATLDDLVALLVRAGVELVADVRSKPRSRLPHFDQIPLEEALAGADIAYRFVGYKLGGMPRDPQIQARWRQGHLDPLIVAHLRATDEWQDGLSELARLIERGRAVCLLCSEGDPNECHRKAVALDLVELIPGLELAHLAVGKTPAQDVGVQEVLM